MSGCQGVRMCQDLSGNVRKCQDGKKVQRVKRVPEGKRFGNPSMEREGRSHLYLKENVLAREWIQ